MARSEFHPLDIEDAAALEAYLRRTGRLGPEERLRCTVLTGGVSNRVVWVERPIKPDWVLKQALPKLRVAVDWFSGPERIEREALGLGWLRRLTPAGSVPSLVFEDPQVHLLAMEAVPKPHQNWKRQLLEGALEADHIRQFATLLGSIHRGALDFHEEIARAFADRTFFESLRLEPYYEYAARQLPDAAGFLRDLVAQTRATRLTLVHGDYSPKNVLICRGQLVLLDHEVIHHGDPAFDLGFSLTHLLAKALHLADRRRLFGEAALNYWQHYCAEAGSALTRGGLEERAVRHTLGCLLARVAGRSPLEYLTPFEREIQTRAVLDMLGSQPATIPELVAQFLARIGSGWRGPIRGV